MKKPPIGPDEKRPPYHPRLHDMDPDGSDRHFLDQNGHMWIYTTVRRRAYICFKGYWHKNYYRTHWRQGREDWVACHHEVN